MKDLAGKELNIGDVVVTNAGYNNKLTFGIVKRMDYNLHFYNLNRYGPIAAQKDMGVKVKEWHKPWYCFNGSKCVKVSSDLLPLEMKPFYNEIMQILNKNVTTSSNT
jgi:hypothetical protein